jgi:Fic family protein
MWDNGLAPILQSVATAFGFIYIHQFQDGNGRVHRCLIHHVLAERKYTPPGMVFPVSSVMLDRIDDYCTTLQAHSAPLMDVIEWRPTQWGFERMSNGKYLAVTRPSFGPEYRSLVR